MRVKKESANQLKYLIPGIGANHHWFAVFLFHSQNTQPKKYLEMTERWERDLTVDFWFAREFEIWTRIIRGLISFAIWHFDFWWFVWLMKEGSFGNVFGFLSIDKKVEIILFYFIFFDKEIILFL